MRISGHNGLVLGLQRKGSLCDVYCATAAGMLLWPLSLLISAELLVSTLSPHVDGVHKEKVCFPMAELLFGLGRP